MTMQFERPVPQVVSQWRAKTLQMVNWGGYNGHHRVDLDVDAVLISGASGTGKSTLQDAYTALMNDYNIPFNGASNANVVGRARSAEQRNVLSYVRGKVDETRDEDTHVRDQVLRGGKGDTWSAVAMTWVNDDGTLFTAMRLYYAPAAATTSTNVTQRMATFPGEFNLADVEQFALMSPPFHKTRMESAFPGLEMRATFSQFSAVLFKRLGIGKSGDGQAAMRLLARIQSGRHVASVDTLFKDLVLETPGTYEAADKAIEHFDKLESLWATMQTAQQQIDTLAPIPGLFERMTHARAEADLIDTFRIDQPHQTANTALAGWAFTTEAAVVDREIAENRATNADAAAEHRRATKAVEDLDEQMTANKHAQWENGGNRLEDVRRRLVTLHAAVRDTDAERAAFTTATAVLGPAPGTHEEFSGWQTEAARFLAAYPLEAATLRAERDLVIEERSPLRNRENDLLAEKKWLEGRRDLIPSQLDQARLLLADAARINPGDLPFVAELIDLHPDHQQWREAAELLLGGFARTLLVDRSVAKRFRDSINDLRMRQRINFNVADSGQRTRTIHTTILPGRLIFREESPFLGWVQRELEHRFDYVCVNDTGGFGTDDRNYITLTGQTKSGDRGSHGGHGQTPILGFSNEARITAIESELADLDAQIAVFGLRLDDINTHATALDARKSAHERVAATVWERIDHAGAQNALADSQAEEARLLEGNDILIALREEEARLKTTLAEEQKTANLTEHAMLALEAEWVKLCDRQDAVKDRLEELDDAGVVVSDEQAARLDEALEDLAPEWPIRWVQFDDTVRKMVRSLTQHVKAARDRAEEAEGSLTRVFFSFNKTWPDPNAGVTIVSYDHYKAILDDLESQGLAERRERFTQSVLEWSGQDLLALLRSYSDADDAIQARLDPVNEILRQLPFGPGRDRLNIKKRAERASDLAQFKQELRSLSGNTTVLPDVTQVESRFKTLQRFIKRLRKGPDGTGERDHLLDVRRHIHVDAERLDAGTLTVLGVYDNLGGKSGGETQELIAFIVGAALRYQLGNEFDAKPVYAPVLLDEAFIKADSQFAGRAVNAWLGLGFQLLLAAPLDKVTAIEPYMPRIYVVTKSPRGFSHIAPLTRDTEGDAA